MRNVFIFLFVIFTFSLFANYIPLNSFIYSIEEMQNIKENKLPRYPLNSKESNFFSNDFYIMIYDSSSVQNPYDMETFLSGSISLNKYWSVFSTIVVLQHEEDKPYYIATEWKAGLSAVFAETGIEGKGEWWRILIGKKSTKIGFSPFTGLLFSGMMQMEGIDINLYKGPVNLYAATYLLPPYVVKEDSVVSFTRKWLYKGTILNRYISLHGIEIKHNNLLLGFAEAILYAGEGRMPNYFNPLNLYYGEQYDMATEYNDNVFWDLYGNYMMNRKRIYWELFIDDFQYERKIVRDYEPQQIGLIIGYSGYIKELYSLFEVSFLMPWVYNQTSDWNRYVIGDISPGSQYGPDHLHIKWDIIKPDKYVNYVFSSELLGKGVNNYDSTWIFPDTTYTKMNDLFLSGDETITYNIGAGIIYKNKYGFVSLKAGINDKIKPFIKGEFILKKGADLFE